MIQVAVWGCFSAIFILYLVTWTFFLRVGLAGFGVKNLKWRSLFVATLAHFVLNTAIALAMFAFSHGADEEAIGGNLLGLVLGLLLNLGLLFGTSAIVVVPICRTPFWRGALSGTTATILSTIVTVLVSLFVLRPFFLESYYIPTNAMAPTLVGVHTEGVCLECDGRAYGRAPRGLYDEIDEMICEDHFHIGESAQMENELFQGDRIVVAKFIKPQRWDIVAFKFPGDPTQNYVKRLIGLPGETVVIKDGKVRINGKVIAPPKHLKGLRYVDEFQGVFTVWGSETDPAVLGDEEYFMLGDYTTQSADARLWETGADGHPPYAVPKSHIFGVVTNIYWPRERWRVVK